MLGADRSVVLDRLDDELQRTPAITREIFYKVIENAGTRLRLLRQSGKAIRIDRLIEAGAWTEAAFVLIELALPAWRVRRLVFADGEWLCSLSRRPNLPMALDDTADAGHEILPLALLRAFVEAGRRRGAAPESVSTVPQVRPTSDQLVCCDNFA